MRNILLASIVASMVTSVIPDVGQAQGKMLYVSSLSQTYTGTGAVGSDLWLAATFRTGNNSGGYALDSVQLGMADASGNPSGIAVMLYANSGSPGGPTPGANLGGLSGPASPSTAGVYSYAPTASLTLSPATFYFVVLTAGTAIANGAYSWGLSAYPPIASAGWAGINGILQSPTGTSGWSQALPYQGMGQFAIYATAVPEPGVLSMAVLGGLLFLRRRRRTSCSRRSTIV
jgi:MYXO-CTERM domain-containing protein